MTTIAAAAGAVAIMVTDTPGAAAAPEVVTRLASAGSCPGSNYLRLRVG